MNFHLSLKPPAFTNVVFVDGLSRSGKKLTCRIISHLKQVEYFQYVSAIEKFSHLNQIGVLDDSVAASLIRATVDEAIYTRAIGRNLNARESDETSITRAPDPERYFRRCSEPDGKPAMDKINESDRIAPFHTHYLLPNARVAYRALPHLRIIHVSRHPLDIAADWMRRGWGKRWGTDPLVFGLLVEDENRVAPWYASTWIRKYDDMTIAERCIESVLTLQEWNRRAFRELAKEGQDRLYMFPLERLIAQPKEIIADICKFLDTDPLDSMPGLLESENLPAPENPDARLEGLRELEADSRSETVGRFREAVADYEKRWGLEPVV